MQNLLQQITETTSFLQEKCSTPPQVGMVLGTGLGKLVDKIKVTCAIPYSAIPNFPTSTVEFHKGQLLFGSIGDTTVVAMQGRFHYYEGYSMQQITFPIRVMKALGVSFLCLSNAAGGINLNFKKGDLVLIDDHINLQPDNPLRGITDERLGSRFPDMSAPYHPLLIQLFEQKARQLKIPVHKGVYAAVMGPNLETRAEYRYLKTLGADVVGMSTVPEVIVANQVNLPCLAVSVVTDECDPEHLQPVNIAEIIQVANQADEKLSHLFESVIMELNNIEWNQSAV